MRRTHERRLPRRYRIETLLIGGGPRCQIRYRDYLFGMLDVMGIGPLPERAFTTEPYCTDWLDSEYSQQRLQYQRHSFQEVVDDIAREVVTPGSPALDRVARAFGREMVRADGSLDRAALGAVVFADEGKRRVLEGILHPLILDEIDRRVEQFERADPGGMAVVDDAPGSGLEWNEEAVRRFAA